MARKVAGVGAVKGTLADAQGGAAGSILRFVQIQGGATVDSSSVPSDKWVIGVSGELMSPAQAASYSQDL